MLASSLAVKAGGSDYGNTLSDKGSPSAGKWLRRLREAAEMTQAVLAVKVGVHKVTIAKWERDKQEISSSYLPKLADALGVEVGDLFPPDSDNASKETPGKILMAKVSFGGNRGNELIGATVRDADPEAPAIVRVLEKAANEETFTAEELRSVLKWAARQLRTKLQPVPSSPVPPAVVTGAVRVLEAGHEPVTEKDQDGVLPLPTRPAAGEEE